MIKTYNKLVRDRISEIIENTGKKRKTDILADEDYLKMIDAKFDEELADLLEVIYAANIARGCTQEELEQIRITKS